jgi:hypothetical protein
VGALQDVDRVDLDQPDALEQAAHLPAGRVARRTRVGESLRGERQAPGFIGRDSVAGDAFRLKDGGGRQNP